MALQQVNITDASGARNVNPTTDGLLPVSTKTASLIVAVPTTSGSAYASGQNIGGLLTFTSAVRTPGSAVVLSVAISDISKQDAAMDLVLFTANPSLSAIADKTTFNVHQTDILNISTVINIATTDYSDFSNNSVASKKAIGGGFVIPSGTTLYGALVSRGTPTYTSSQALQVKLKVLQD